MTPTIRRLLAGRAFAAFGLRLPTPVAAAAYFLGMGGVGLLSPLWETEIQRRVPAEALGRVGSFDTLISFAARWAWRRPPRSPPRPGPRPRCCARP
ncbi:hypothetical protein ACGFYQ_06125 [Streptomyces sp. NPDC048258]|uniref:hypothetical protein n=1 Tax=Streptomyces sp. NPDC048258 TaxID=3365527 RepID=UPI00372109F4